MSSTYTKHYQDSLDRKIENNDVVRRLLIVDNNLANISQGVNALGTSNVGNAIAALDVQVGLIPRTNYSSNFLAVGNQLTRIENTANAIPTYNASNGVAQLIGGQSNQAIIIGGISSDTQAIRNNDIPRLATGNQVNALSSSIASGRNESNAIPRNTYNAQLNVIQTGVNNIPVQTYNVALGNIQTTTDTVLTNTNNIPRANHSNQLTAIQNSVNAIPTNVYTSNFTTVNTKLDSIQATVNSINSGSGSAASVIAINASQLIVPLNVNAPEADLIYWLGASPTGYIQAGNVSVGVSAPAVISGSVVGIFTRGANNMWYTDNFLERYIQLDFGRNKAIRSIAITGLGILSYNFGFSRYPVNLLISGSNDSTTYNAINTWSNIGFTVDNQWKYTSFSNNIAYRYIRLTQLGFNGGNDYMFGCKEVRIYGTINNP